MLSATCRRVKVDVSGPNCKAERKKKVKAMGNQNEGTNHHGVKVKT